MVWLALLVYRVVTRMFFNTSLLTLRSDAVHPSGFAQDVTLPIWSIAYVSFYMFRHLDLVGSLVAVLLFTIYVAVVMVACAVAQVTSCWTLLLTYRVMGVIPKHFKHCRIWTASCIAVGFPVQRPGLASVSFALATMCFVPRCWLWFPTDAKSQVPISDFEAMAERTVILKRSASLLQSNNKRPRRLASSTARSDLLTEASSLQNTDATDDNTQKRYKGDYGVKCNDLAMSLTRAANAHISRLFVDGCGLTFDVSLHYLGELTGNNRKRIFNFVWKASTAHKVLQMHRFTWYKYQVDKAMDGVNVEETNLTLSKEISSIVVSFPPEWTTAARACNLQQFSRDSAERVAKAYDGVHIECR